MAFIIIIYFCEYVALDIQAEVLNKLYIKINCLNGIATVNREENDSMKVTQAKLLHANKQLSIQRFKLQEANEQIIRSSEETQLQNYIMKNFTSSLDIDKMLKITIDAIMDGLKCDLVSIGIVSNEPNEDMNVITHSEYTKESGINKEIIKEIESIRCIKECHNHNIVIEISNYASVKYEYIAGSTIKSLIVIPATINENAYCVYTFGSCKNEFFEKNKDFIQNLSNQITLSITNLLLYMKMHTMAIKDPLTNIYNRRHFNVMSDTFKKNYIDKNRKISVVLFDIDISISYLSNSPYCPETIICIESFIPNPVTKSAVHPAIPSTVIKNLFLYLNIFLNVTLLIKLSLFHIKSILSNNILFPFFGAFGLISADGSSINSFLQAV